MNQFHKLFGWAWSALVVCTLAFAMGGCDGKDGAQGPAGRDGVDGSAGPPGVLDEVQLALEKSNVESCGTCHDGVGDEHQAVYNEYVDSNLVMTITGVTSVVNVAGGFDLTVNFSLELNGAPYADNPANFDKKGFYVTQLDAQGEFVTSGTGFYGSLSSPAVSNGDGTYTFTTNVPYDVNAFAGGAVIGSIGLGGFAFPDNPYTAALPGGSRRIMGYKDLATAAFEVGGGALSAWESVASVEGCQQCHGTPYRKHGNIEAVITEGGVASVPNFSQCKACHVSDKTGGHQDWQYMVDDPYAWATGQAPTADYTYTRNLMNDVHMSHAMELPYPMSMSNCATCHRGAGLTAVLDNSNFTPQTCKSCHAVQGIEAWPKTVGTTEEGLYAQPHRPPPLEYLWAEKGVEVVHNFTDINAANCQTNCHGSNYPGLSAYHSGYDKTIYDSSGNRYADTNTVSVDAVTLAGNLLTVEFSATNAAIDPTLSISFYGWDSKHFIVPAHERDGNATGCPHPSRPGCNIEWSPGSTKPFFTEEAGSVAGAWIVTFDMAGFQPYKTDPIPTLITNGVVKFAEVTVLPELAINGEPVNIEAFTTSFDLTAGVIVDDYFQGANATVNIDNCKACHDNTGLLEFHQFDGRFGDSMQTCKSCHATIFGGSHWEMQSRSIDSYVHAIHAFQPMDENTVYVTPPGATGPDPVFVKRNEMHKEHVFPYFSTLACNACHVPGTYNVPDQSKSMPGVQSASDSSNNPDRSIGSIPESVQGAANRSCGSCHRANLIKHDSVGSLAINQLSRPVAGELASLDAHTGTFGTFVENDPVDEDGDDLEEEPVLFGVIDKIMSLFE